MPMWTRNTGRAALVAAGAVAVGAAFGSGLPAAADTTSGNFSILGGNQAQTPISIPVDVSGNALAVLGAAAGQSKGGAEVSGVRHSSGGKKRTSGNFSIGGGNQIHAPISIPVNVCGNAIAILGLAQARCKGGASVKSGKSHHHHHHGWQRSAGYRMASGSADGGGWGGWDREDLETSGNFSILGGNQVIAPISVPVNVCGNAIAVLGVAAAHCKGGASVKHRGSKHHGPKLKTSGDFSILGGNQVIAPISVPVNVCGNAIAVLGVAVAHCKGGASVESGHDKPWKPKKKWHKPHKPHKQHKPRHTGKLPSTLRGLSGVTTSDGSNESNSRRGHASAPISLMTTDRLPAVKRFVTSVKRVVRVSGVNIKPSKVGPNLPTNNAAPVKLGTP